MVVQACSVIHRCVLVRKVKAIYIIDIAVAVVVDAIARNFTRVDPDVG